ncbi:hypothetical protein AVEN_210510-1 [Araneus ventricosus]|uniref:DUF4817 domain-containing protein n=1 Tax=Araneus ventricosus TaxID=182803 RepID=A0A4Y2FBS2_ARAVE|nr:hypothetical protein AVEN_210510-1 [Araneus ventricosus]
MPTLQENSPLVKLLYLNQQNSVAVVNEFRRIKHIRRGPMSSCVIRQMLQKFQTTSQLAILLDRGQKQIPSSSIEVVVTAVVEANSQFPHGSEQLLHPDKVTVWCSVVVTFVIGPYFFEEITANGIQICSVTGQRYRDMLRDFGIPQIQILDAFRISFSCRMAHLLTLIACKAIAKTAYDRCTGDQPSFSNSMASSFARYQPLRLLIVGFPEGPYSGRLTQVTCGK